MDDVLLLKDSTKQNQKKKIETNVNMLRFKLTNEFASC